MPSGFVWYRQAGWFNIKIPCYQCSRKSSGDKAIYRSSYPNIGNSHTGKKSLYLIRAKTVTSKYGSIRTYNTSDQPSLQYAMLNINGRIWKTHSRLYLGEFGRKYFTSSWTYYAKRTIIGGFVVGLPEGSGLHWICIVPHKYLLFTHKGINKKGNRFPPKGSKSHWSSVDAGNACHLRRETILPKPV